MQNDNKKLWHDVAKLAQDCIPFNSNVIDVCAFTGMAQEFFDVYPSLPNEYRMPSIEENREHRQAIYELCHMHGAMGDIETAMHGAMKLISYLAGHLPDKNTYGRNEAEKFLEDNKRYLKPEPVNDTNDDLPF